MNLISPQAFLVFKQLDSFDDSSKISQLLQTASNMAADISTTCRLDDKRKISTQSFPFFSQTSRPSCSKLG